MFSCPAAHVLLLVYYIWKHRTLHPSPTCSCEAFHCYSSGECHKRQTDRSSEKWDL